MAEFPGKFNLFFASMRGLGGRAFAALFCLSALAAALAAVSVYTSNALPVAVEMEGQPGILAAARVCGVSLRGEVSEFGRKGAGWAPAAFTYTRKMLLVLPKAGLHDITKVSVRIGPDLFEFGPANFREFAIMRMGRVENQEWDVFEFPDTVRHTRSLFPNFSPVNWGGDLAFCAKTAGWTAVYLLLLLVPWYILFSSRGGSGAAAIPGEVRPKGCSWFSLTGGNRSREVSFGRTAHLVLVFLLTAGVVGALSFLQVDPHHDGVMLKPAIDVARGQALFRDTFTQYGAMSVWVQALAVKLAGEYLLTIRLLTALTYGLIAVLMWLVYARFLPAYLATFSCLSWLFLGYFFLNFTAMFILPWSTVLAVCAALLALHLMLKYVEGGGERALFAAGGAVALVFWFKINYGAAVFLSAVLFLALLQVRAGAGRARVFGIFIGGGFSLHALMAAWLWLHGSFHDFVLQSVKYALVFSGNTIFSSGDALPVRVLKSLLQVNSPHGGISFLWLLLPLAACAVFLISSRKCLAAGNASVKDKSLLAVSVFALGLWLGYYPIPALFHMYLSSVLFFGLYSWLVLAAAERRGLAGKELLVLAITVLVFLPDLRYRLGAFSAKLARASSWERIESPAFLRGMYVPPAEKRTYAELEALIRPVPGGLLNMTNSGLFSLYKEEVPSVHKIYMDWGWINSYLYPDYIPAIAGWLKAGSGCIVANAVYMAPGYVPVKVFRPLQEKTEFSRPVVLLLPGRPAAGFKVTGVDSVLRPGKRDDFPRGYRFRLKALPGVGVIDSVVVRLVSRDTLEPVIPRYAYEYGLLERALDPAARERIRADYVFDAERGGYALRQLDAEGWLDLMDAVSGEFLYEKGAAAWDTFIGSGNTEVYVSRNGKPVGYGEITCGIGSRPGDSLDLVAPAAVIAGSYVARIRINYKGRLYQEETLRVLKK